MKLNTFEIYGVLTLAEFWGSSICLMTGGFNWLFAMLFSAALAQAFLISKFISFGGQLIITRAGC